MRLISRPAAVGRPPAPVASASYRRRRVLVGGRSVVEATVLRRAGTLSSGPPSYLILRRSYHVSRRSAHRTGDMRLSERATLDIRVNRAGRRIRMWRAARPARTNKAVCSIVGLNAPWKHEGLARRPAQEDCRGQITGDAHAEGRSYLRRGSLARLALSQEDGARRGIAALEEEPGQRPKADERARRLLEADLRSAGPPPLPRGESTCGA